MQNNQKLRVNWTQHVAVLEGTILNRGGIQLLKLINSGSFGFVYEAKKLEDNTLLVVKFQKDKSMHC